jgi:hypothetical protein
LIFCARVVSVSLLVSVISTWLRLVSAVNAPLATVPKRSVNVPDPTALVAEARLGLTSVCPLASCVTSSVDVPRPVSVPLETVATALLVIVGLTARSPSRTRVPSEDASELSIDFSVEASEICVVILFCLAVTASIRAAYCAAESCSARPELSIVELPSDASSLAVAEDDEVADVVDVDEVDEVVVIPPRTAGA